MRSIYSGRQKEHRKLRRTTIFFKKKFCNLRSSICLIKRDADNLINFEAVVKNRLSKFKLLKCCKIFQQRSQMNLVSNQRGQVLQ